MNIMDKDSHIKEQIKSVSDHVLPAGGHVWLYGSKARGDSHSDSDWDLLILINKDKITSEDEDNINYPFVMMGWREGACVSPLLYTFNEWEERAASPFYQNVERDKIRIL